MIPSNIRVPGSYSEVDTTGANTALPEYRQPILVVAPRIKTPAAWVTITAYALGAVVKPVASADNYYICITAGTSGASEPTWPGIAGTVTDGTVVWRELVTARDIVAVNTPTKCYSGADGAKYAGAGSVAARMVDRIFRHYRYSEVTLITVDDDGSGVKATGSLTFTGTATSAGTINIYIGSDRISYSYAVGEANTAIATAIDALIAAHHDLPVSSNVSAGVLTLRSKAAGTVGNLIGKYNTNTTLYEPVVVKTTGDGISVTVTGFSAGATDPDLANAFTAATTDYYGIVAIPYTGADQVADLEAYLNSVSNEVNCKGARAFLAITSSIAAATTLADTNHERIHVAFVRKCRTPAWEIAAMVAADHAAVGHEAIPLNGRVIDCDAPEIVDRLEWSEINSLLWNGVTPYNADAFNSVRCIRSITTYQANSSGSPDPVYLDTTTIAILDYFRIALRTRHLLEFQGKVLRDNHVDGEPEFIVTPEDIRSVNIDVALRMEKRGSLQNVKLLKDRFISARDADVQGRVNSDIPTEVVQGLHVLANTIRLVTTN